MKPQFVNVQYHKGHSFKVGGEEHIWRPSMTGLDDKGHVWRTFCRDDGTWAPWAEIMEFG